MKNVKINTGGRGYGKVYQQELSADLKETDLTRYLDRMTNACIKHQYENKELELQRMIIKHQQKIINRLSRKIQRLKRISLRNKEITLILYCIDLVIQNFGENRELEKIYNRLYLQKKEHIENEKKGF